MKFSVSVQVPRPIEEVFDHVVEPGLLSSYFTSEASGPLEAGKTVRWDWAGGESSDVEVEAVERNRRVVLKWKAFRVETLTRVTIAFETAEKDRTKVTIEEAGWEDDAAGQASAFEHCAGWQHMLLCLKARMAFGIDLRG
jgi:uncharacterized protein YndB with AHSA1/START domain